MKRTTLSIAAAAMTLTLAAPALAATHTQHTVTVHALPNQGTHDGRVTLQRTAIDILGSAPYYVPSFHYMGTEYLPVSVLSRIVANYGDTASWDAHTQTITFRGHWRSGLPVHVGLGHDTWQTYHWGALVAGSGVEYVPIGSVMTALFDSEIDETWDKSTDTLRIGDWQDKITTTTLTQQEAAALNPRPLDKSNAQWLAAISQARAFAASPRNNGTQYSALATRSQWYPDPSDIFYNKRFALKDLKNGMILQHSPLVEVTTENGQANTYDAGYVFVQEYVGQEQDPISGETTWWRQEQVSLSTGRVTEIAPTLAGDPIFEMQKMRPVVGQGYDFGTHQPSNVLWVAGTGLDAVPLPNWMPIN